MKNSVETGGSETRWPCTRLHQLGFIYQTLHFVFVMNPLCKLALTPSPSLNTSTAASLRRVMSEARGRFSETLDLPPNRHLIFNEVKNVQLM